MRIENNTHYQTAQLRAFVTRTLDTIEYPRERRKALRVRFGHYTRGSHKRYLAFRETHGIEFHTSSGHAYLGGNFMHVSLAQTDPDKVDFAHTIAHEAGHCMGLQHRDMKGGALWMRTGNWREIYGWAADLPLDVKPPELKPSTTDKRAGRLARIEVLLKQWESKRRRAERAIQKLNRRKRALARAIEKAP